jgi:hypothetical protein
MMGDRAGPDLWFMEGTFPLIVCVAPREWDEVQVGRMIDQWERYFARAERYALLSHTPRGGGLAGGRLRRKIADWANEQRVRQYSADLCVGSSTVVRDTFSRAALRAMLWFWKPPSPHLTCSAPDEAFDWCVARLVAAGVPLGLGVGELRERILPVLEAL